MKFTQKEIKEYVEEAFAKHTHQQNVIVDLYKMVFPNWDKIVKIEGYPKIGLAFWTFIWQRFLDFDRMFHPEVMAGGAWMNWGFSCDRKLGDWKIDLSTCTIQREV
jgi:hypothetical protein